MTPTAAIYLHQSSNSSGSWVQKVFQEADLVDGKVVKFHNILDRGYRGNVAAFRKVELSFHNKPIDRHQQVNINIIMKFFSLVALAALSGAASSAYAKETSASIIVSDSHIR
jgi:hypothetical protein